MGVRFRKLSGAGNDFVVLAAASLAPGERESWVRRVCRRGVSVGADGVILVDADPALEAPRVAFYNPDGREAGFCGNGARCAARWLALEQGRRELRTRLHTRWGVVDAWVEASQVSTGLPPVVSQPHRVVLEPPLAEGWLLSVGVPHLVIPVTDCEPLDLPALAPRLRWDRHFGPEGTNVDFLARTSDRLWSLRSWERGVEAETLACGSGVAAAAVVAWRCLAAPSELRFRVRSGSLLEVELAERPDGVAVRLTGEARLVFEAELGDEALGPPAIMPAPG